jgi:toxin ParE1/3/4
VPELRLSRRAAGDLAEIADYIIQEFGIDQARLYRDQLDACFRSLLVNSQLGRSAKDVAPGLRRIRQQAHVVFYTFRQDQLGIGRVLDCRMEQREALRKWWLLDMY